MPAIFIRSFEGESEACEAASGLICAGIEFRYKRDGEHTFEVDSDDRASAEEIFNNIGS